MKRFLLIFLCFYLFTSCSSTVKTNTLVGASIDGTEVEALPVTADLAVLEQKTRGEAIGKITDLNNLTKEALAKALWQEQPSVDRPDVLVGLNVFTEVDGADLKVTLTGYPAYYINFRTATKEDSLRLNMVNSGASPPVYENKSEGGGNGYFSMKYQFGDGFGFGIGLGMEMSSGFFIGLEGDQGGLINDENYKGAGGGLTLGGIYDGLPYDIKLVFGSSLGFWLNEKKVSRGYDNSYYHNGYYETDYHDEMYVLAPFVKARWHGIEAGLRLFTIPDTDLYFTIGYTF